MGLARYINKESIIIMIFAFLLTFYYIVPQSIAIVANAIILIFSIKNINKAITFMPIKWYFSFIIVLAILVLLRVDNMTYLVSSVNVGVIIFTQILTLKNKRDINLFVNSVAVSGFLLCMYIQIKFAHLFGIGRLGMEMDGTRIDSAITLGYIFLYISSLQIYALFDSKNKFYKVFLIIAIIFTFYLTLLTGTRKALMIPVFFLFVCLFFEYKKQLVKLTFIMIISLIAFVKAIGYIAEADILDTSMIERWEGVLGFLDENQRLDESSVERVKHINDARNIFFGNPLFGVGINKTIQIVGTHAHNNYLTLLSFGGVVLFLSYYWIYIYFVIKRKTMLKLVPKMFIMGAMMLPLSDMGTTSFNIAYFNIILTLLILAYKIEMYNSRIIGYRYRIYNP